MGLIGDLKMGHALTSLVTVLEEIAPTPGMRLVGIAGGLHSLPVGRRSELEAKIPKWLNTLRQHPRHAVTRELIKNAMLASRSGRHQRAEAYGQLLERLVQDGIALDLHAFQASYMD